jgi:hypothetical protein
VTLDSHSKGSEFYPRLDLPFIGCYVCSVGTSSGGAGVCDADQSLPSVADVKGGWTYTSAHPIRLLGTYRYKFTFLMVL